MASKQSDMNFNDHLEFVAYCEKIGKAYSELIIRQNVIVMLTGRDLKNNKSCTK